MRLLFFTKTLFCFVILFVVFSAQAALAGRAPSEYVSDRMVQESRKCTRYYPSAESRHDIPEHLLASIGVVESGRYHKGLGMSLPWPWTINVDGQGYYFDTKAEAIRAVKRHQREGAGNIDVGCMQISLKYHGEAFGNLSQAFEPSTNIAYAADFLNGLHEESGSWRKAVGHYHSRTPSKYGDYASRVFKTYKTILAKLDEVEYADSLLAMIDRELPASGAVRSNYRPAKAVRLAKNVRLPYHKAARMDRRRSNMRVVNVPETKSSATAARANQISAQQARTFFSLSKEDKARMPMQVAKSEDSRFFSINRPASGNNTVFVLPR